MSRALDEARLALGVAPPEAKSRSRSITDRNRQMLERGRHPATGLDLRPDLGSCGDCLYFRVTGERSRRYFKCAVSALGMSRSESSDIRKSWPACARFQLAPQETTP